MRRLNYLAGTRSFSRQSTAATITKVSDKHALIDTKIDSDVCIVIPCWHPLICRCEPSIVANLLCMWQIARRQIAPSYRLIKCPKLYAEYLQPWANALLICRNIRSYIGMLLMVVKQAAYLCHLFLCLAYQCISYLCLYYRYRYTANAWYNTLFNQVIFARCMECLWSTGNAGNESFAVSHGQGDAPFVGTLLTCSSKYNMNMLSPYQGVQ